MKRTLSLFILTIAIAFQAVASDPMPHSSNALRELAIQLEHGRGVPRDYQKAIRLYCLATLKGDVDAHYHLGWMYFNSRGVERNDALAAGWFLRGSELGDQHSQRMLERLTEVEPKSDTTCAMTNPTRAQIEQWVTIWAPEYGLEPELVIAVIEAESNFVINAKSHKGALGLMQLIPATAKRFGVQDAFNPVDNMHGGMAYLQWLLKYFKGVVNFALAGYNAGEHAVERYSGVPPYQETKNYIRRIAKRYPKATHPIPN